MSSKNPKLPPRPSKLTKDPKANAGVTNEAYDYLLKIAWSATDRVEFLEAERPKPGRANPKRFRIDMINVHAVAIDSEPSPGMRAAAEAAGHEYDEEAWQDIVVTIEDRDGSKFEVGRTSVQKDGMVGDCTYVAELVCARSWGTEEDDDSVSCPLCYHRGHGAGACHRLR